MSAESQRAGGVAPFVADNARWLGGAFLLCLCSSVGPGVTGLLIDRGVPYTLQITVMALYCLWAALTLTLWAKRRGRAAA